MKHSFKTGVLLIFIGMTATLGLIVITGKQAVATNNIPNPAYGFGFCVYNTGGELDVCYEKVKRLHTDEEYRRCMKNMPHPTACLDNINIKKS
jgi:hypothetical protein